MAATFYAIPSAVIAIVLAALLAACVEAGHRAGRARSSGSTAALRDHVNTIQSAFLGLLALLLAFTFSLALQRFDSRSDAVVAEANAIGSAFLRADLLPTPMRDEARRAISRYLDARVEEASVALSDREGRLEVNQRAAKAQAAIWEIPVRASHADAASHSTPLFVGSVNDLIDSFGRRSAAVERHVPELVTALLFITFLLAGSIVGFAAGLGGHRPATVTYVLAGLLVVLAFIVLDLDRPRRGIIQVSQASLLELQVTLQDAVRAGRPPGSGSNGR